MSGNAILIYDDVPASSNHSGGGARQHWGAAHREKKKWEGNFLALLLTQRVPKNLQHVRVKCELQFKSRHRRDPDNYMFPISKPLGDALTLGGYIVDDGPDYYTFEGVTISKEKLEGAGPLVKSRMKLTLEYE